MTRRGPWTLVLLFVFASISISAPPSQAQLEETGSVKGLVCGDPYECYQGIPGATVTLTRTDGVLPHQQTATTDGSGTFLFDGVPHGAYKLVAERKGFSSGNASLTVDGGESAQVRLEPAPVSVALRVEDADGEGLDAHVSWYSDSSGSGATEAVDGDATLKTRGGHHTLVVESSGYSRSQQWLLLDGSAVEVVMSPVPPQDAVVLGTVRDQDGAPVAGAVVQVHQYGGYAYEEPRPMSDSGGSDDAPESMAVQEPYYGGSNRTTTAADGSYRIHVWAGEVELNVWKDGHAGRNAYFRLDSGDEHRHDVELPKYPAKTAHLEGRVLGADGQPLRNVRVSVWLPEYGIHECSDAAGAAGGGGSNGTSGSADGTEPAQGAPDSLTYPAPDRQGCAITMDADGTFSGDVTPGYAIVEAWHDHWSTCSESRSSDGSASRSCGPEYLGFVRTLVLPADDTTELVIQMRARPAADATISGYVVDGESRTAIPGVQVQFNNQETYGWGSASTDGDGSYKVGARGGYHQVYVHADGYLPWQGTVQVPAGGEVSLDIVLTPGQAEYGSCCYAYDEEVAYASDGAAAAAESSARAGSGGSGDADAAGDDGEDGGGDGSAVEDLGGGLGPYDPQKRAQELQQSSKDSPGPALVLLALALVGAAFASRRHR